METIAAILFSIGVAGSTTLAVLTVCMIGARHKQKRFIALDRQRKATQDFWNKYWATCVTSVSICTASRNWNLTESAKNIRMTNCTIIEPNKLDVTEEFGQLERVTQKADK